MECKGIFFFCNYEQGIIILPLFLPPPLLPVSASSPAATLTLLLYLQ